MLRAKALTIYVGATMLLVVLGTASAQDWAWQDKEHLELLITRNFQDLDARLRKSQENYLSDRARERDVDLALDTFYRSAPELEKPLTEWVTAQPKSYSARLARGVYYTKLGWVSRGAEIYSKTEKKNIDAMTFYFEKAYTDLEAALEINPKLVHALCYEIEILMNFSASEKIMTLRTRALEINPLSLTARWYYITTLLPRWGGSIAAIDKEVNAARAHYARNPALKILDGRVQAELGDKLFFAGQYAQSVEHYDRASAFGEHWFYSAQRGEAYSYAERIGISNRDLDAAIRLRPNFPRAYYMRGFNEYSAGQYGNAVKYWDIALRSTPQDAKMLNLRGDANLRLGHSDRAYRDFSKAVDLDPGNAEYIADLERVRALVPTK